jgi:hypothetical protein
MYFNNIPQGFGLGQYEQPQELMGKPVLGYNEGINAIQQKQPSSPAPQLSNISNPTASTSGLGGKTITPLMPYNKPVPGQTMAKGGVVKQTLAKGGVVSEGIAALRGQHPDPRAALDAYDKTFGPDATAELMRSYADGGVVSGPGSGVADLVPGSIDGREDVRIASGEYVIPAWAVATLGDGSTEAGAKVLDAMVARLREEGSELIKGVEPINPSEFLPA